MTWMFSRAIEWRIQRLKVFAEHVLDASNLDEPLPEEGEETALLNKSLRRMASRIRELVERLSLESARRDVILKSMAEGVLAVDHQMRVLFCNQSLSERARAEASGGREYGAAGAGARSEIPEPHRRRAGLRRGGELQAAVYGRRIEDLRGVRGAARGSYRERSDASRRAGDPARHHGSRTAGAHPARLRGQRFARAADTADGDPRLCRNAAGRGFGRYGAQSPFRRNHSGARDPAE